MLYWITLCFNYLLFALSFSFPRRKHKWVFGNYVIDQFGDNPKYMFLYVRKYHPDIRAIWITRNERIYQELRQKGLEVYKTHSIHGLYHCLTAGVYLYNTFPADINYFTSGGALLVNMWHGVGLKTIEFSITRGSLANCYYHKLRGYRLHMPWRFKRPDYLLSSSPFQSAPFSKAFRIPEDRCLNFGYPRNDVMVMPEAVRLELLAKYDHPDTIPYIHKLRAFKKVLIYMPTWRDSPDFLRDLGLDMQRINAILRAKDELLILKMHVNTANIPVEGLSNIWIFPWNLDVYAIFPYTHTLITDYSSVLYDYILLPDKEVILFTFDMKKYLAEREFNYPFLPNVAGLVVEDLETFYQTLASCSPIASINDIDVIRRRFWGNYNGHAAKNLTVFIKEKLGLAVPEFEPDREPVSPKQILDETSL
jgi:CDP-glycerol glycerophosphotransferase (TagB/SpsB family)